MLPQPRHGLRRRPSPWPPDRRHLPVEESPHTPSVCGCALLRGPDPPGSSRWAVLRSVQSPASSRITFLSRQAGPGPSGSTGPFRRCHRCCPPSPPLRGSGCPQLQYARCDEHKAVSFHHRTIRKRLVALDIRHPQAVRRRDSQSAYPPGRRACERFRRGWSCDVSWPFDHALEAFTTHQTPKLCTAPPEPPDGATDATPSERRTHPVILSVDTAHAPHPVWASRRKTRRTPARVALAAFVLADR